VTKEK
jgi:hypothetical protein